MKWHRKQAQQQQDALKAARDPKNRTKRNPVVPKPPKPRLTTAVNSLDNDIQRMINQYYDQAMLNTSAGKVITSTSVAQNLAAMQSRQNVANYAAQQYQLGQIQQAAANRGKQNMAVSNSWSVDPRSMQIYFDPRSPGRPTPPDRPPQFEQRDRVIVGQGKVIYVVKSADWDGYQYWYAVVSPKGITKKVEERSLRAVTKEDVKQIVSFDSVILDDEKKASILETMNGVDNHDLIFNQWGFDEVMEKGKATSFLFWGPPGTGKTLMAQAIADKLDQPLLIIGSAEIESSEPGGAERAIKQFFQTKGKVLLFDECDSLVYERAAVGAILGAQVNALLTSLETYEGTVIFTTNRLGVLDEAFNRRLSLKVEFAMPDAATRVKIWQRMFPKKAPVQKDIDWERLASVEIAGGYIKNAVLRAARMAASRKHTEISEEVIVEALRLELTSMIEFEDAKASEYHVPRQGGPTLGISRTKTMDKIQTVGGQ